MNIEIKITADSVEEARAAFAKLAGERPATHITVIPSDPRAEGGELTIPAGTDLTIASASKDSVTLTSDPTQEPMQMPEPEPAPEKPKRKRVSKQAAEMLAESAQAATTPAEPVEAAEEPVEAAAAPAPTMDQIANAGARLLDADAGKMMPLLDLLREFGVQAITQLKDDQLAAFAERLRGLGAEV